MSYAETIGAGQTRRGVGRVLWAVLALLGLAGWIACAVAGDADRAWRALLVSFAFFTPVAAGMVVWPAIAMLSRGRWMEPVEEKGLAGIAFAPVSLAVLAALWFGRAHWAAWQHAGYAANAAWLNAPFVFGRNAAAQIVLWALAAAFVGRGRRARSAVLAGFLCLAYVVAMTLMGFDFIMALNPRWVSTLFGGYFFVTGLYGAVTVLAFRAARDSQCERRRQHDLAKLMLAFGIGSGYMMFSQWLPIWYENLPQEVLFVVPRLNFLPWAAVSAALVAVVYLGPLVLLLTVWAKRTPWYLASIALLVLLGLWVERWWLIAPTVGAPLRLGLAEISAAVGLLGAFGFGLASFPRRAPVAGAEGDTPA